MILVVDDHRDVAAGLCVMIAAHGHATAHARDGLEAIEHLRERAPRRIVLDYHVPRMNGIELLRHMRDMRWLDGVPLVLHSANPDPLLAREALRLGAVEFVAQDVRGWDRLMELADQYGNAGPRST